MPESGVAEARANRLLAALPEDELRSLLGDLRPARHAVGDVLHEADEVLDRVHFPTSGVLSLVTVTIDGAVVEVATVGDEGMVGVPVFLGSGHAGNVRAVCQMRAETLVMSARAFRSHFARAARLREVMGAYVEFLLVEAAQAAACNRLHPIEERLARWLLQSQDRARDDEFPLTHEFLAEMLGVRRSSVTVAAGMLSSAGLISYRRGRMRIVDRAGLERASCECYQVVRAAQERLLPPTAGASELR